MAPIVTGQALACQPETSATAERNQTARFTPSVINFSCVD
jgi:hypothetical protein